jgi:hypothetical protein
VPKLTFLFTLICLSFLVQAQTIRYGSDARPIIEENDKTLTIKNYEGVLGDNFSFVLTADTLKKTLLKAVVQDGYSKSTRTYYFHNDYLLKVTERFHQPDTIAISHRFFLNPDYALSIDYKDPFQKEIVARQKLQNDAYKFLLHYRRLSNL